MRQLLLVLLVLVIGCKKPMQKPLPTTLTIEDMLHYVAVDSKRPPDSMSMLGGYVYITAGKRLYVFDRSTGDEDFIVKKGK